ncbi:MAG TPA: hypothetical protein VGU61_13770, partial [Noviherbaspirillum sp.]|uniref:hypothetical protein n=1 Tax=Noviherbaspirillum sp. TaxID=1926288 RepID=UPI002DDDB882
KRSGNSACIQDAADEPPPTLDRDQVCLCINIWAAFYPERLMLVKQVGQQIRSVDERGARSWGG